MKKCALVVLLAALQSGCFITTTIQGGGRVTSVDSGSFDCATGQVGDCSQQYSGAGAETLRATPDAGFTFARWQNCRFHSLDTCTTSWNASGAAEDATWPVTATFREQEPPVQAAHATYNALGQRVTRTVGGTTLVFLYDLEGNLVAEIDAASGLALRRHVHLRDEPVALLANTSGSGATAVHYVHADHLGTPVLVSGAGGQVVADIEATPFGETYIDYDEVGHRMRFPGQYRDDETGLHYNNFRDYDPRLGRYIQSDPIGLDGGLNTYGYALQNPLRYADRWGLYVKLCSRKLAALDSDRTPVKPSGSLLRHDFLSVSGATLSFQASASVAWSPGRIDTLGETENPLCEMVCEDDKFDRYVFEAASTIGAPTYCLLGYGNSGPANCQSWARRVLARAKQEYLDKEECPECWSK